MTNGFCDSKTSHVALSPRWLSGPLRVVKLLRPTDDKVDACTHDSKCHLTVPDSSVVQIESSILLWVGYPLEYSLCSWGKIAGGLGSIIGDIMSWTSSMQTDHFAKIRQSLSV